MKLLLFNCGTVVPQPEIHSTQYFPRTRQNKVWLEPVDSMAFTRKRTKGGAGNKTSPGTGQNTAHVQHIRADPGA